MELIKNNNEMALLDIRNLVVHYVTDSGVVEALNDISLTINKGETLGLVGETGAGKTTIAKSIMGLLPVPPSRIVQGEIIFEGEDLTKLTKKEYCNFRGRKASMIFQDPMTALNPLKTVGKQIAEVIINHKHCSEAEAELEVLKILEKVGIPPERFNEYPHQFSGGMKQRIVIAIALACRPNLLIADEPTTALDVTIQAQVIDMMNDLKDEFKTSIILITHDLGVVAEMCDKVAIMYAGEIVEFGKIEMIFDETAHPYTEGLFNSIPHLESKETRLKAIKGLMPDPANLPTGCKFHERCPYCKENCKTELPEYRDLGDGHMIRCHYPLERRGI